MPAFVSKFMSAATHWEVRFMVNGLLMGLQLLEAHVPVKFFISNNADVVVDLLKSCKRIFPIPDASLKITLKDLKLMLLSPQL